MKENEKVVTIKKRVEEEKEIIKGKWERDKRRRRKKSRVGAFDKKMETRI